jgi:hypothetical protein
VILKLAIVLILAGLAAWIFLGGDPEDHTNDYP